MMEADSVHSTLENIFVPPMYAPSDYIAQMRMARPRKPYHVKFLDYKFFKKFESLESNFKSIRPGVKAGDNVVTDIRALLYKPSGEVSYKVRHNGQYEILQQRRRCTSANSGSPNTVPPLYEQPLKIKREKFKHLQELKNFIPAQYHFFYDSLQHD